MARPGTLCFIKEGKAIGAQKGFARTWNWMVAFVNNLSGANGIEIDRSDDDHPVIKGIGNGRGNGDGSDDDESGKCHLVAGTNGVDVNGKRVYAKVEGEPDDYIIDLTDQKPGRNEDDEGVCNSHSNDEEDLLDDPWSNTKSGGGGGGGAIGNGGLGNDWSGDHCPKNDSNGE